MIVRQVTAIVRTGWYRFFYQFWLRRVAFGRGVVIQGAFQVQGPGKVRLGPGCQIGRDIWGEIPTVIVTHTRHATVEIGARVALRGATIGCVSHIQIDDDCVIDHANLIDADFHHLQADKRSEGHPGASSKVYVGAGSYVSGGGVVMKGANLGALVKVYPNTVIGGRRVPESTILCGVPARSFLPERSRRSQELERQPTITAVPI